MLESVFGSKSAERVLLYLQNYGDGYAQSIAKTYGTNLSQVQKQLRKFEDGGILVSRPVGNARVYTWKPGNPIVKELRALLQKQLELLPAAEQEAYYRERRRPRRAGKPT